jgi:hypothetical protein
MKKNLNPRNENILEEVPDEEASKLEILAKNF